MIVSMPPRDKNQNRPMNWNITKKNPKASWKTKGSALTNRDGASTMPSHTGSVLKMRPMSVLRTNRISRNLTARPTR